MSRATAGFTVHHKLRRKLGRSVALLWQQEACSGQNRQSLRQPHRHRKAGRTFPLCALARSSRSGGWRDQLGRGGRRVQVV